MSIQKVIQLNNQVVSSMESKLFNDAVLLSYAAMEMLQQHQHMVAQGVSLQRDDDSSIDQFILDHDNKGSSDNVSINDFIYEHGIVLPSSSDTMDPNSVIVPVLIFNCALSHQLLACNCNHEDTSRSYYGRAKGLYQLAYDQQDDDMNMIFKFAILNNIGIIHKSLGNYEESRDCFVQLVSLMMVYVDVGVESKHLQRVQGFWKNVLENDGPMLAPAA